MSLDHFYNLSEEEGSFIGFKNENGKVIQFEWIEDNIWKADIPELLRRGSFQKLIEYDECVILINSLLKDKYWQTPADFSFIEW